jgi:DNA-binding SARP family transcriptional activator
MGHFDRALQSGLAAVRADPLRESAHRAVIAAHLAEGNRMEAIRQYRVYRNLLNKELNTEPTSAMERLVEGLPIG